MLSNFLSFAETFLIIAAVGTLLGQANNVAHKYTKVGSHRMYGPISHVVIAGTTLAAVLGLVGRIGSVWRDAPRHLSSSASHHLVDVLKGSPGKIQIMATNGKETEAFGAELSSAFKEAGWDVYLTGGSSSGQKLGMRIEYAPSREAVALNLGQTLRDEGFFVEAMEKVGEGGEYPLVIDIWPRRD